MATTAVPLPSSSSSPRAPQAPPSTQGNLVSTTCTPSPTPPVANGQLSDSDPNANPEPGVEAEHCADGEQAAAQTIEPEGPIAQAPPSAEASSLYAGGTPCADRRIAPKTPETDSKKPGGKGLGWSNTEIFALCRGVSSVSARTPAHATTVTQFGKQVRAAFLRDATRPADAGAQGRTGGPLDVRRWDGRSIAACLKRWAKVKLECGRFRNAVMKVRRFPFPSGVPAEVDVERCATFAFNEGALSQGVIDSIVANPSYPVGKPFVFLEAFRYLVKHTALLEEANEMLGERRASEKIECEVEYEHEPDGIDEECDDAHVGNNTNGGGDNGHMTTPMRKSRRMRKASLGKESQFSGTELAGADVALLESGMQALAASRGLDKSFDANVVGMNADVARHEILLKERRFQWEMAKELFGPSSDAPEEEKLEVKFLLRKSLLKTLRMQDGRALGYSDEEDEAQVRKRMRWDSPSQDEQTVVGATGPNDHG